MINNITFNGRETMLVDAAQIAEQTAKREAAKLLQIANNQKAEADSVVKASSVLQEIPYLESYPYVRDDIPVNVGTIIDHLA